MITMAAVLGMMPSAVGRGIGAEMRNGVGAASVGGILVSGILTLLVIPVLYDLFTRRAAPPETRDGYGTSIASPSWAGSMPSGSSPSSVW